MRLVRSRISGLCAYPAPVRSVQLAANLVPLTRRAQSRIPDLCAYPYPARKTRLVRSEALSKSAVRSQPSGLCLFCHALVQTGSLKLPANLQERSEEHTSELQSRFDLVCRLLLEKKKN